jgi:hypothetical protein
VNWNDPVWRSFQKSRQAWILEFAKSITQTIKATRPTTVTHQYSTVFHDWRSGVPLELRDTCDYVGRDFYGGASQYLLACRLFNSLTHVKPFEFHTSRTIGLGDFETTKPLRELTVSSFVATLHSAALSYIDAVKPDGGFNHSAYTLMGTINDLRKPYEPFLGGDLLADVAIYYDRDSFYDPTQIGMSPVAVKGSFPPHLVAMTGVARILGRGHLPYGIVTNVTLDQLRSYRALIVPDVLELTAERAEIFRKFVHDGGVLIATGTSSLERHETTTPHFLLEDVLGVRYIGMLGASFSYLTPLRDEEKKLILPQEAVSYAGPMVKAEPLPGTVVMAAATLPWVSPDAGTRDNAQFAQIWISPPAAKPGSDPGITLHPYGKGKAIWIAAPIETADNEVNGRLIISLLTNTLKGPCHFEADTHPSVQLTLFDQPERSTLLLGLLNMQTEDPPFAVPATVRVKAPEGKHIVSALHLPDKAPMKLMQEGLYVRLSFQPFLTMEMAQLKYE